MFDQHFPVVFGAPKAPAAGPPVISGAGVPVSGTAGHARGQHYQDTSKNPAVVYENVGDSAVSSWMSLLSGNVV